MRSRESRKPSVAGEMPRRNFLKLTVRQAGITDRLGPVCSQRHKRRHLRQTHLCGIGTDDSVTVIREPLEMGQGSLPRLPMILADELDADWTKVRFEPAPVRSVL